MRYASVCSGVGTDHLAFAPLGWECAWFAEIDPFASAVLAHHFPAVPNLGDMTALSDEELAAHGPVDLLVGGTPCQGFSSAGRGAGLDDPRSGLALSFVDLARRLAPRWVLWENVSGVRNRRHADDLAAFIGAFREIGYLGCFRSLDARYFGVPQRRDRVFALFHPGDWRPPAAVLLEPDCVRRDPAARGEAQADVAGSLRSRAQGGCGPGAQEAGGNQLVVALYSESGPGWWRDGAGCLRAEGENRPSRPSHVVAHTLRAAGADASEDGSGRGTPLVLAFNWQSGGDARGLEPRATASALHCGQTPAVLEPGVPGVRRLTPLECERLQGLPDHWTLVPYNGKPAKDGPRYRAIGNGIALPVLVWIGRRIAMAEELT